MSHSQIPHLFAVVRTQSVRGPSFQLLEAHRIHQRDSSSVYTIYEPHYIPTDYHLSEYRHTNDMNRNIHVLRYYSTQGMAGRHEVVEHKFWYIPYILRIDNEYIPIIEFKYKSWLPNHSRRLPIREDADQFMHVYEDICEHMSHLIQQEEMEMNNQRFNSHRRFNNHHFDHNIFTRAMTPRIHRHRHYHDDDEDTNTNTSSTNTNTVQTIRVVVTDTQYQALPLPKPVGTLILTNARSGEDSCPIAATPYKDCTKLSVCSCFHVFDSESLEKWKAERNICPVCRTNIVNVITED
jgi:hypothetical protein